MDERRQKINELALELIRSHVALMGLQFGSCDTVMAHAFKYAEAYYDRSTKK